MSLFHGKPFGDTEDPFPTLGQRLVTDTGYSRKVAVRGVQDQRHIGGLPHGFPPPPAEASLQRSPGMGHPLQKSWQDAPSREQGGTSSEARPSVSPLIISQVPKWVWKTIMQNAAE